MMMMVTVMMIRMVIISMMVMVLAISHRVHVTQSVTLDAITKSIP